MKKFILRVLQEQMDGEVQELNQATYLLFQVKATEWQIFM